ncbi:MAG: CPBP family intramembrane glutamic endopeptidase [Bacteroidia bacterium]
MLHILYFDVNTFESLRSQLADNLWLSLFFSLFLYTLGIVVLLPVAGIIITLLYGISFSELTQILSGNLNAHSQGVAIFRLIQAVSQVVTWGLAGGVMLWMIRLFPQVLGLSRPVSLFLAIFPIAIIFSSIPLVQAIHISPEWSFWPSSMLGLLKDWAAVEQTSQKYLMEILGEQAMGKLLLNLLIFALLPAFCEELFFRGFLQKKLSETMRPQMAIFVAAFIFSFAHFQFLSFFSRLLLGWLLGYCFHISGRLWLSILAHFGYNAATILLVYYSAKTGGTIFTDITETTDINWQLVVLSTGVTVLLLWIFTKLNQPLESQKITHE